MVARNETSNEVRLAAELIAHLLEGHFATEDESRAYFTEHIHMYERSFPVMKGRVEKSYRDPKGVVHVNTGNSGGRNGFANGPTADFTAFRLTDVPCYTRVTLENATHMRFEQARADNGSVVDSFQLFKSRKPS